MRRAVPAVLALLGVAALAAAAVRGELSFALVLILPVLVGEGPLAALGMLLLFAATVAWLFLRAPVTETRWEPPPEEEPLEPRAEPERRVRHGGVVLLGPIPIAWGSDRRMLVGALALAAVVALLVLLVLLATRG